MKRIKVLLVSDDIRIPSGVGIQSYKLLKGLQKIGDYELVELAGSLIPGDINPIMFEGIKLYPSKDGYGNPNILRAVISMEKPDVTIFFSDPRFFTYAFTMDDEIRPFTKLIFYHTWDNPPFPVYNKPWYAACDQVVLLSRFSYNLMKSGGVDCECITHGGDPSEFYPMEPEEKEELKKVFFGKLPAIPRFVILYNNRNIARKRTTDVIYVFKQFWETHQDSLLLMKTPPLDMEGNDLQTFMKQVRVNNAPIVIQSQMMSSPDLLKFYNVSDVTINIAVNEGFGLSCMESLLCGVPNIATKTGGLTEQMTDGQNTFGILMEPEVSTTFGIVGSPYIFQDYVSNDTIMKALCKAYDMKQTGELQKLGELGKEHIIRNYHINSTVAKWDELIKKVHASPSKYQPWTLTTL